MAKPSLEECDHNIAALINLQISVLFPSSYLYYIQKFSKLHLILYIRSLHSSETPLQINFSFVLFNNNWSTAHEKNITFTGYTNLVLQREFVPVSVVYLVWVLSENTSAVTIQQPLRAIMMVQDIRVIIQMSWVQTSTE